MNTLIFIKLTNSKYLAFMDFVRNNWNKEENVFLKTFLLEYKRNLERFTWCKRITLGE